MKRPKNPRNHAELQEAVDAAAACRLIADCMMYGLLQGGMKIDAARCDEILAMGESRGVRPSAPAKDLALGFIQAHNAQVREAGR